MKKTHILSSTTGLMYLIMYHLELYLSESFQDADQ